ncbi:MAG: RNB domain-containing ribonuclease, partial [Chlamydiia bacterium]|nr:RNB domain-containing ribonuclease [Chlamydiia bacterium]
MKSKNIRKKKGKFPPRKKGGKGKNSQLPQAEIALPRSSNTVQGQLSVHPRGFGFVKTGVGPDVFIPKHRICNAVDGDEVEVEIASIVSPKGPEGSVIAILKRNRSSLAGTVIHKEGKHSYLVFAPLLGKEKPLRVEAKETLQEGDRIICHVEEWNDGKNGARGTLTQRIGHISDPSIDVEAAIAEFELPNGFSKEVVSEAKDFGKRIPAKEMKKRIDLTEIECVTIDPDTAKDFDDAISLTQDEKGHFHLGVHIADVAHYVKPGSHLDKEAFERCNSTYFPGQC